MHFNQSMEENGTTVSRDLTAQTSWVQSLEDTYFRVRPGFSGAFVGTGCFGIIGNVLILIVFTKMGFSNTIHMSYSALAVSDLCCVLASMVYGITAMDVVRRSVNEQTSYRLSNMFGGLPHICFSRVTALLTAWISLERCLCVKFPTRVKLIITSTVTKVVILAIFLLGCLPMVFVYIAYRFEWQPDPRTNSSTLNLVYDERLGVAETFLILLGVVYPVVSWVTVTFCTSVLVLQLRQSYKWRKSNTQGAEVSPAGNHAVTANQSQQQKSTKENHVTKVVVMVAVVFLLCSVPVSANILADLIIPEYSIDGTLRYLHLINGMINVLFTELNSSLNVVVFSVSGQKFRSVLFEILSKGPCKK